MTECESVRGKWGEICPDCGQRLPVAKPWDHGRPCAKTALDRGRGWDGRPAPEHTEGVKARWSNMARTPSEASRIQVTRRPDPYRLTARQAQMLEAVTRHAGNRSAAARDLECTPQLVAYYMRQLAIRGISTPASGRGRRRKVA